MCEYHAILGIYRELNFLFLVRSHDSFKKTRMEGMHGANPFNLSYPTAPTSVAVPNSDRKIVTYLSWVSKQTNLVFNRRDGSLLEI